MEPDQFTLLIVDDEIDMIKTLTRMFKNKNYNILTSTSSTKSIAIAETTRIDCAIIDLRMPEIDGIELLKIFKKKSPNMHVIIITAYGGIDTAVKAVKLGACNFYEKPFKSERLIANVSQIETIVKLEKENRQLKTEADFNFGFDKLVGLSDPMLAIKKKIMESAKSDAPALITGETGCGKEIVARAMHMKSNRVNDSFITVDCSALPETVIESELFGHARGSFTGAVNANPGLIKTADKGTLFLDEIAEIPYHLQSKLLRVIQEQEIRPVGGVKPVRVNIRIIAATNRSLEDEVKNGRFRNDLFYRLNVIRIEVPPLRHRKDDIPHLCSYFLKKYSYAERHFSIEKNAVEILMNNDWPGNVRELENTIRRALIFTGDKDIITPETLSEDFSKSETEEIKLSADNIYKYYPENDTLTAYEKAAILNALDKCGSNRTRAAELLSMSKASLYRKLNEYSI